MEQWGGLWRRHTTTYEFEMSVAGGHRVWLRKLLLSGWDRRHLPSKGYYQMGVPISLFRQLRSTGCFKEQLLFLQPYQVPLKIVLSSFSASRRHGKRA